MSQGLVILRAEMIHAIAARGKNLKSAMGNSDKKNCVFCQIVKGESERIPLLQTETVAVITPRTPRSPGHVIVIPKGHYKNILDVSEDVLKEMIVVVQQQAKRMMKASGVTGVNILNTNGFDAGQRVFHFHIHVIPRYPNDGLWLDLEKRQKV